MSEPTRELIAERLSRLAMVQGAVLDLACLQLAVECYPQASGEALQETARLWAKRVTLLVQEQRP